MLLEGEETLGQAGESALQASSNGHSPMRQSHSGTLRPRPDIFKCYRGMLCVMTKGYHYTWELF